MIAQALVVGGVVLAGGGTLDLLTDTRPGHVRRLVLAVAIVVGTVMVVAGYCIAA